MTNNNNNSIPTRLTTDIARLTYAFLWEPRSSTDSDSDSDGKDKKYSTSVLIPKNDQLTFKKLDTAIQHAIAQGQKKGFWGEKLPSNFKLPIRDGDEESAEKGEEYAGHWFLNASSTRLPRIVDSNLHDILDPNEVYSGCYARVVLNMFPFSAKGNRGIGCGLVAVQKVSDGEPLGGVSVDLQEAFGEFVGSGDPLNTAPTYGQQSPCGYPSQQFQNPTQQVPTGYLTQPQQGYLGQQQVPAGYPMQQSQIYSAQQIPNENPMQQPQNYSTQQVSAGYPTQSQQGYLNHQPGAMNFLSAQVSGNSMQQNPLQQQVQNIPVQQAPGNIASGVAAADSMLPPQMFAANNGSAA